MHEDLLVEFAESCAAAPEDGLCCHAKRHQILVGNIREGTPVARLAEVLKLLGQCIAQDCAALASLRADFLAEVTARIDMSVEVGRFEVDASMLVPIAAGPSRIGLDMWVHFSATRCRST